MIDFADMLWIAMLSNVAGMLVGVLVCILLGWRPPQ